MAQSLKWLLAMRAWGPEFRALEPKRKAGYWWHAPVIPALGWAWWHASVVPAPKPADTEGVWKLTAQSAYSTGELRVQWETLAQKIQGESNWRRHTTLFSGLHTCIHTLKHTNTYANMNTQEILNLFQAKVYLLPSWVCLRDLTVR